MKIPLNIQPARVRYEERDLIPVSFASIAAAVIILPLVGFVAYLIATLIFQLP